MNIFERSIFCISGLIAWNWAAGSSANQNLLKMRSYCYYVTKDDSIKIEKLASNHRESNKFLAISAPTYYLLNDEANAYDLVERCQNQVGDNGTLVDIHGTSSRFEVSELKLFGTSPVRVGDIESNESIRKYFAIYQLQEMYQAGGLAKAHAKTDDSVRTISDQKVKRNIEEAAKKVKESANVIAGKKFRAMLITWYSEDGLLKYSGHSALLLEKKDAAKGLDRVYLSWAMGNSLSEDFENFSGGKVKIVEIDDLSEEEYARGKDWIESSIFVIFEQNWRYLEMLQSSSKIMSNPKSIIGQRLVSFPMQATESR